MCWVFFKIIHHRLKQIQSFHNSEKIFFYWNSYLSMSMWQANLQECVANSVDSSPVFVTCAKSHHCLPKPRTKKSVPKQLSGGDYFVLETAASPKMYTFSFLNGGTLIV